MKGGGYVSKPKQMFSIRIDPEILLKIRRLAKGGRTTIGAIVRESLDGFLKSKEEADDCGKSGQLDPDP